MSLGSAVVQQDFSPRGPRSAVASRTSMGAPLFRLTLALAAAAAVLALTALVTVERSLTVGPQAPVHDLGRTVVYPAANPSALVVLALAALGLVALLRALRSVARQAVAQRALARSLAACRVREVGEVIVIS